ncbi:MAG: hypothetical protein DMG07_25835, partial [Acidobacteria bacterium]
LSRFFRLSETAKLEFRAESFNLTNHTNFALPGLNFNTATFGVITSALDARGIQLGARFIF